MTSSEVQEYHKNNAKNRILKFAILFKKNDLKPKDIFLNNSKSIKNFKIRIFALFLSSFLHPNV